MFTFTPLHINPDTVFPASVIPPEYDVERRKRIVGDRSSYVY